MKKGLYYTVSANTQIGRDPMTIITEDMRCRKRLCDFAQKHGVINAARRYKTNRMFVYRQLARFDGSLESLRLKSTKSNSHPNCRVTLYSIKECPYKGKLKYCVNFACM